MPAPAPDVYRPLDCGDADRLATCSHLAMRVWLRLFWGPDSERAGIVICRPALLADDLGSSKRAVMAALDELVSKALIVHDPIAKIAGRPGFEVRHLPADLNNRLAWLRSIPGDRECLISQQVRAFIGCKIEPAKRAAWQAPSQAARQAAGRPTRALAESTSPQVQEREHACMPCPSGKQQQGSLLGEQLP